MDAVPAGGLGGTFSGNPVSCEAALGVFEEIEHHDLLARAAEVGRVLRGGLLKLQGRHDVIGDVRGRGAMMAIELVTGGGDRTADPALTGRIARRCHQQGLLVLTAGSWGNVLRFLPPLSIPDALLTEGLDILGAAIAAG
jgi:4-aminobutyrate aminotransferase/(S)-3-amino-2-methylpropionate transaminase